MSAEFWVRSAVYAAVIVLSIFILIVVKRRDRDVVRELKKRISRAQRDLAKVVKDGAVTKNEVLGSARRLNAAFKLAQQAAYNDENLGFDRVRDSLGEARELVGEVKVFLTDREELVTRVERAREWTAQAERQLAIVVENAEKVYGKKR